MCSSVSNKIISRCNFLTADSIHGERSGKARNTQTSESGAKVPRRRIDSSMSDWHVARGKKRDSWPYRCHVPTRPWPLAIRPLCDSGFFQGFTVFRPPSTAPRGEGTAGRVGGEREREEDNWADMAKDGIMIDEIACLVLGRKRCFLLLFFFLLG